MRTQSIKTVSTHLAPSVRMAITEDTCFADGVGARITIRQALCNIQYHQRTDMFDAIRRQSRGTKSSRRHGGCLNSPASSAPSVPELLHISWPTHVMEITIALHENGRGCARTFWALIGTPPVLGCNKNINLKICETLSHWVQLTARSVQTLTCYTLSPIFRTKSAHSRIFKMLVSSVFGLTHMTLTNSKVLTLCVVYSADVL